jgi:hypothetical protein
MFALSSQGGHHRGDTPVRDFNQSTGLIDRLRRMSLTLQVLSLASEVVCAMGAMRVLL